MANTSLNGKRVTLETSFRHTVTSDIQKNVVQYLKILRDTRYTKLLSTEDDNVNRLIGELRMVQKLLDVLEQDNDTLLDLSLIAQSS